MDETRKKLLQKASEAIVHDVEISYFLEDLVIKEVISRSEAEEMKLQNDVERGKMLLNTLEHKSNTAYDIFTECLRKDYSWLYEVLKVGDDDPKLDVDEQHFEDAMILGDLPRLPSHYIDRTDVLLNLRDNLKRLKRGGRIVLHGMTGSGKSCLAAAAVHDKQLLKEEFNYKIYWFNLGETRTDEQILKLLHRLNQRLTKVDETVVAIPNSLGTNDSIVVMRDYLKKKVASPSLFSQALLILDNVCSEKIIPALDIGCKMIITTQDRNNIVHDQNTIFMSVTGGFTEEETLTLFAKSLNTTLERIKKIPEAKRVSDLCKGQPMLIDLIGTLFKPYKEDLLSNGSRWNHYIEMLTKKKDKKEFSQIFGAIELCITDLDEDLRAKYEDFVVFVEDVNIMPEVLQILWEQQVFEVQDVMTELENKSLIVSYYNQDKGTYIYGIHDLLLAYLKKNLSPEEIRKRHEKLISAYKRVCNGNFAELPNDNYIYQYIAHHLKQANLISEFRNLYFDLNFIGAKIRATGIADLIRDFEGYGKYITNDEEKLIEKLQVYRKFIEANGEDLHKYQDTDIIQCGLQQRSDSPIYKAAYDYAVNTPNSLYFKLQAPHENHYYMHTLALQEDFYAACFTESTNEILVGTSSGNINLWEQTYNQKLCTFEGHTGCITYLQLSPDKNEFLSVSTDGQVKLWRLHYVSNRNSNSFTFSENSQIIPSPRLKQAGHQTFFGNDTIFNRSRPFLADEEDDKLIAASFSNHYLESKLIVTGSQKGSVVVHNVETDDKIEMTATDDKPATCVAFSMNDDIVISSSGSHISLFDSSNGAFLSRFNNQCIIKSLLVVPDDLEHCLIAISDHLITKWTWNQYYNSNIGIKDADRTILCEEEDFSFLCGAVTEDGAYLVVASSDYYTRMWNIDTSNLVESFHNKNGLVISLDTFYEDNNNSVHILLSGSDDKTVKQLHVFPESVDKKEIKNLEIFDAIWENNVVKVAIATEKNSLQILRGRSLVYETDVITSAIKQIAFSKCGGKVAYGLQSGSVEIFDEVTEMTSIVMMLNSPVNLLKYFKCTLIAAANDGTLMMYSDRKTSCLRRPPLPSSPTYQVPMLPIVQSYYLNRVRKLLTITKNRSLLLWNLADDTYSVLLGDRSTDVTSTALSEDEYVLALTMDGGTFEVYNLVQENSHLKADFSQVKHLGDGLCSCAISSDNKYLALGRNTGNIEIWSLEMKVIFTTLSLHKCDVRHLAFSPSPELILISVGEQIAWWDISKVPIAAQNKSRSFRRRSNSLKKQNNNIALHLPHTNGMKSYEWGQKIGSKKKPHLLSTVKLHGLYASTISTSPDYTSFFAVDNNGEFYVMELLCPVMK